MRFGGILMVVVGANGAWGPWAALFCVGVFWILMAADHV